MHVQATANTVLVMAMHVRAIANTVLVLAMHVRAARTNGVSVEEIKELLLQTAIYCGVPDANTAFRIAQRVLSEMGEA